VKDCSAAGAASSWPIPSNRVMRRSQFCLAVVLNVRSQTISLGSEPRGRAYELKSAFDTDG
jgi:hypothetical protein